MPYGDDAQARDEAAPRPSRRSAALDWPARTNLAEAPPFGGGLLTALQAELWLKAEMLRTSASSARRRLDAARRRQVAAAGKMRSLRRELEASRQACSRPLSCPFASTLRLPCRRRRRPARPTLPTARRRRVPPPTPRAPRNQRNRSPGSLCGGGGGGC